MRIDPRSLPAAAVLAFAIAAAPADAAAKCRHSDGVEVRPGYVLIVDGRVVREFNGDEDSSLEGADFPTADDVFSVEVICRDVTTGPSERPTRQTAIVVVTKAGVRPLVQAWLTELVEAQQAHRARTGSYAGSASELGLEPPLDLQLELIATATGWSAATHIASLGTICSVAIGSAAAQRPEQEPGIPACQPAE